MKNIKKIFLVTMLTVFFAALLSGCNKKSTLNGVSFLEDTITIEKYETYTLNLLGVEDKEITWKSADKSKATVVDGVVYAKQKGSTTISACIGNESISCEVIISDNKYVPSINLNEPKEGINLMEKQSYVLNPILSYNGNDYTDVEYSYSAVGETIAVDDSGKITTKGLGSGIICVKGLWRDNVIETSVAVNVIDVTTSIEVGAKHFEIYLNGYDEYPGKADLGITIFDKNVQIKKSETSVKYVEKTLEGDTQGAATIKNGVAYPSKVGTTHFVAEYTAKSGETVESACFSVTVKRTPADIYMTPIEGEEFEFFFEPLGAENSVVWDEELQAYHLINKVSRLNDARGFIINREYLTNIIKFTKAESIAFEYKTDGNPTGANTLDKSIYQGFYPEWFTKDQYQILSVSEKWTKIEIPLDSIPKDENGNYKTIFLMNTIEGMYIRNIKLYLPGEDRTNYDPNHNYLEDIKGEEYEFFIESLTDENSVVWDAKNEAYHLINNVTGQNDKRGFIFNKDYLTNIVKHTDAETISFEYKWDGKLTGCDTLDKGIYQGFYPNWYDPDNIQRVELSDKWIKITIPLDSIPKDESGNLKTVFLMNTVGGMYVRNIKVNLPIVWTKLGGISLGKADLTWTHGDDTGLLGGNAIGTVSFKDGVWKLADCYAFSMHEITFSDTASRYTDDMKVRMRIKATPNGRDMANLKLSLYSYDAEGEIRYASAVPVEVTKQGEWTTVEFAIESFLTEDKQFKGFGFMTGGYNDWKSGEKYTIEFDQIEIWGPQGSKITKVAEEPKPEYGVIGEINFGKSDITWTHGEVTGIAGCNNVGTLSYTDDAWKLDGCFRFAAHEMTFSDTTKRFTDDMKVRIHIKATPNGSDMGNLKLILLNYDAAGTLSGSETVSVEVMEQGEWTTVEFDIAPFLNDENQFKGLCFVTDGYNNWDSGEKYTIELDKIEILGLPGSEITEVEQEQPPVEPEEPPVEPEEPEEEVWEAYSDKIYFNTENVAYGNNTLTNLHNQVNTVYTSDNKIYCKSNVVGASFYGRKFTLETPITDVTSDMKLRMRVYVRANSSTKEQADFRLYHVDYDGDANSADNYIALSVPHGEWTEIEFNLAKLVDSDGTFRGFQYGNFDDATVEYYFNWIEIWRVQPEADPEEPPVEPEEPVDPEEPEEEVWEVYGDRILFNETNVAYANNTLTNLHNSVSTVYTTDNKIYCKTAVAGASFYGRKFVLNTPITDVTSDMKLRMMVYVRANSSTKEQADFRLYHVDYAGDANSADNYIALSVPHGAWTEIEFELSKLVDSNGTFRGFQYGNFDDASVEYYFNWIEIWRVQPAEEPDEPPVEPEEPVIPEEPEEEVWEVYGDRILFNETNVAYANNTLTNLHNSVSTVYTTDNKIYCKTAVAGASFYGRKFVLNTPITDVTSDMKLRMMVYVRANSSTKEQADFRLYHVDYAGDANSADNYIALSVPHGAWTEIEFELSKLVDSNGTFRGFQYGNFDDATVEYYFNWIEIWRVQPQEVTWDKIQFNTTNFAWANVNDGIGLHNLVNVTAADTEGGSFYCEAQQSAKDNNWLFFGKKFTLNTPVADLTSDMKLRMRLYVSGDNTTQANFRLYNASYAGNANASDAYIAPEVMHGTWTEIEIELAKFLDGDGTFRGFQFGNFDTATTAYYFNWIEIFKPVQ